MKSVVFLIFVCVVPESCMFKRINCDMFLNGDPEELTTGYIGVRTLTIFGRFHLLNQPSVNLNSNCHKVIKVQFFTLQFLVGMETIRKLLSHNFFLANKLILFCVGCTFFCSLLGTY